MTFDHRSLRAKHRDKIMGACACEYCAKLPDHEQRDEARKTEKEDIERRVRWLERQQAPEPDLAALARAALVDTVHNGREWKIAQGYLDAVAEIGVLVDGMDEYISAMEEAIAERDAARAEVADLRRRLSSNPGRRDW